MVSGVIFDIKRYAIHDGPGIRTTVFLKGCPLRCWWCHNPEGMSPVPDIMYFEFKCIHCHTCARVCPQKAINFDADDVQHIDRERCTRCGLCSDLCPTSALRLAGRKVSVEELMGEIERDVKLYDGSEGGVTFSGGEPLFQPKFLKEVLSECRRRYIHTAVDTSGYAPREVLKAVMPYTDVFLYDLKLYDEREHEKYTGVPNGIIKDNLRYLAESGRAGDVILRFPVIPGITDTEWNVRGWARFLEGLGEFREIDLLPFHDVGEKFQRLGREYRMEVHHMPPEETLNWIKEEFEAIGLRVKVGG